MKRAKFNLGYTHLLSANMGNLIPIGLTEVLPGDTVQHATSALLRCSPLLAPVMHPVDVRIHHWYVPHRIVWEDWEDFITGGPDGNDASVFPTINFATGAAVGSLADHYGIPNSGTSLDVNALPFRGYAKIWNEWYRDQDLQTELTIDETSGPDTTTNVALQNVAWEKDYFTSARPWEQKGPAVTIPLTGAAPVKGIGVGTAYSGSNLGGSPVWETDGAASTTYTAGWQTSTAAGIFIEGESAAVPGASNTPQVYADLSGVGAVTINALREALALQRFEEARARFGSR